MGPLFRKEKKDLLRAKQPEKGEITDLELACGSDKETCKALWHTMFLDPRKIGTTIRDAARKAAKYEKSKDKELARMWYHVAGGLALWKGDTTKVKQYFDKCAKLAPEMEYEPIVGIADKAVEKAQEYYKKYLK